MPSLAVARQSNATFTPSYVPIILITGATSGVGEAMTQVFARILGGRAHIILVGRNRAAAEKTIASLPSSSTSELGGIKCTYEFVQCDFTLMKNIHAMADDLLRRLPKINFLIHCAAVAGLDGREDTVEGIDKKMASRYYSRFALTYDLLPLIRKAKDLGEAASVMSVFTAGMSPEIDLDDLGLKKNYGGMRMMGQTGSYNDIMLEEFAKREPDIAWIHTHPGWVYTAQFTSDKFIYGTLLWLLHPLLWLVLTPQEDCAEYMVFALLDATEGLRRYNWRADDIGMKSMPKAKDAGRILYEHSVRETGCKS